MSSSQYAAAEIGSALSLSCCMACGLSIEHELLAPRLVAAGGGLFGFHQDEVLEHEHVDVRPHEAAKRVLGCADDRLPAHVERRVDDHRAARTPVERVDDVVIQRV